MPNDATRATAMLLPFEPLEIGEVVLLLADGRRGILEQAIDCLIDLLDQLDGDTDLEDDELEDNLGGLAVQAPDGQIINDLEATDCGQGVGDDNGIGDFDGALEQFGWVGEEVFV